MRILLITQYFLPQPLANAEVVGGLAEALAARGHVIDVVTPVRGDNTPRLTRHRALGYFARERSSVAARIVEYLSFTLGALLRGSMTPRPDVILVPSPPPTLGLVGVLLGVARRVPVVYNVQDLYPEVAIATGAVNMGVLLRVLGRLMALVYRRSAAVVVIDPRFVEAIRMVAPAANVVAIRNGIDRAPLLEARRDESFLAEIGVPKGRAVVMYAGNVGRSQDLASVARAAAVAGAEFVVHGDGAGLELLRAQAKADGWDHVHFSQYRDRSELGRVFASADVHVVPLRAGIASASVPSKLLSIFSCGRPAIVSAELDSAVGDVMREAEGGWIVEAGDDDALRDALVGALSDADELDRRGARALAWSEEGASVQRVAREYEAMLEEVMGKRA
jgi:colanic acid biosynthesis glycosyl transferase WcaI